MVPQRRPGEDRGGRLRRSAHHRSDERLARRPVHARGRRAMTDVDVRSTVACFIPGHESRLFARLTRPDGPANGIAVTILPGRGSVNTMGGRNRVFSALATRL